MEIKAYWIESPDGPFFKFFVPIDGEITFVTMRFPSNREDLMLLLMFAGNLADRKKERGNVNGN